MEDFEYSLEINDRDWECFFAECEECNLLPPSLAGVDDSGMSDIDDKGSIFAKRVQKVEIIAGVSPNDSSIDGPPDCEGSPVEHYLSKHGVSGMESVLSGSEEDIHLQSVNMFFERLKNVAEAESLTEPCQVRAAQEEECCSDGQQASSTTLPKNIPKLNCLSARGETAVGKETLESVDTISNIMKTLKKYEPGSNFSPEPAASNSALKTNKSSHPETKLFITGETCTETRVNGTTQRSQTHDSPNRVKTTPHTGKVIKVEMCKPLDDVKQEGLLTSQSPLSKKCSTDSWSNVEMVTNVKWEQDLNVSKSDTTSTNKTSSQESSPLASIRRKRRKKRRLSAEPVESTHGCVVKPSDSEEEQHALRAGAGPSMSEDVHLFYINKPQKHTMSPSYSATSNLPVKISPGEIYMSDLSHYSPPCQSQYHSFSESIIRQDRCKEADTDEKNATNERSVTPLSLTVGSVMSASNNSGNVATHLQPCSKLQVEESAGLNKYPGLPVPVTDGVTDESRLGTGTAVCGVKDNRAGSFQQSDKMNHPGICLENEQNLESCTAEVKPLTHVILPSTESNGSTVEVSQNDKLSAAKSVLAEEAGNSGRDNRTLCQREAEPQQQLEIDCHYTDQFNSTLEKTHLFPSSGNSKKLKARTCPFLEISAQKDCAKSTLDNSNSLSDESCLFKSLSSLDNNNTMQQTEHPLELYKSSISDVLSEKTTSKPESARSKVMPPHSRSPILSAEIYLTGLLTGTSDVTPVSSCCTLDTESVTSLSNENITDMSESSCLCVSQNDSGLQGERTSPKLARHEEGEASRPKGQSVSNDAADSQCDLLVKEEDVVTASKATCEPEKAPKHSVFAMSSFWNEMEKLTINDILGLRMISKATPLGSLPPLQEHEEADMFALTDSGFFTQPDEPKNEQANEDTSGSTTSLESSLVSSKGVMWESEPSAVSPGAQIYAENMMLPSVSDISQQALPRTAQTCLRKIYKNVSVHNLRALESIDYTLKGQALQASNEGRAKVECFTDGHIPNQDKDCLTSSLTDSFRISLTDIFQYLFSGKQSNHHQPATDTMTTCYTDGNSVPETYDHFFSEFDTESFFYPLITEEQAKDELVPVFSYSRSANRNLQFPEAYDYFFASSSSDDSSVESDEEDISGPVRVVNRFSRTSSMSKISTDTYENFFTDKDLRQNFFWKNAFSFRNISFTGSTVQKQTLSNTLIPVKQSSRPVQRTLHPISALGNQDVMFPDPLLYHLDDRISSQLAQQPFRYDDLQTAVSNPRLDTSFLPLRQSDMCLVCIAFASWVLKTANPQVGDTWKAVLLANVSALSAIRYLRKYVKSEAAASERKLHLPTLSES